MIPGSTAPNPKHTGRNTLITLEAKKLSKRYGRQRLFSDLDLEIGEGDSLCVWGPNGSGKSTLLKVLAGLVRPGSGQVKYIDGDRRLAPSDAKRLFGIAAPDIVMYDELTLMENVEFLMRMRGMAFDPGAAAAALETFGLGHAAGKLAGTASSGMKQRLRLAAATAHDPYVLLLDEPTSFLDAAGVASVRRFLRGREPGRILVIATNDPTEKEWCRKIVDLGG